MFSWKIQFVFMVLLYSFFKLIFTKFVNTNGKKGSRLGGRTVFLNYPFTSHNSHIQWWIFQYSVHIGFRFVFHKRLEFGEYWKSKGTFTRQKWPANNKLTRLYLWMHEGMIVFIHGDSNSELCLIAYKTYSLTICAISTPTN